MGIISILNQSLAANEIVANVEEMSILPSSFILKVQQNSDEKTVNLIKKKSKKELRHNSYLDPVIIKLNNVIDKYQVKKRYLEDLYMGVVGCGLSRCEKFKNLIPENQRIRRINCLKRKKGIKRIISDLLSIFHGGVQKIDKSFQALINLEKWSNFHNKNRIKILEEFKIDIKTLNVEIETAIPRKRLNFKSETDNILKEMPNFQLPDNQTHLMVYEWRVIQASKKFLRDWKKNLNKMNRCWKRRKQRENNLKNKNLQKKLQVLKEISNLL